MEQVGTSSCGARSSSLTTPGCAPASKHTCPLHTCAGSSQEAALPSTQPLLTPPSPHPTPPTHTHTHPTPPSCSFPRAKWGNNRDKYAYNRVKGSLAAYKTELLKHAREYASCKQHGALRAYLLFAAGEVSDMPVFDSGEQAECWAAGACGCGLAGVLRSWYAVELAVCSQSSDGHPWCHTQGHASGPTALHNPAWHSGCTAQAPDTMPPACRRLHEWPLQAGRGDAIAPAGQELAKSAPQLQLSDADCQPQVRKDN